MFCYIKIRMVHTNQPGTLIVGPNISLQYTQLVQCLQSNGVNRASKTIKFASGKGVNCARATTQLGDQCLLMGFLGGIEGLVINESLKSEGIKTRTVKMLSDSRVCFTTIYETLEINDKQQVSNGFQEIIGECPTLTMPEANEFLTKFESELSSQRYDKVIVTGTSPTVDGTPISKIIVEKLIEHKFPGVTLDLSESYLSQIEIPPSWILKINWREFCNIFGGSFQADLEERKTSLRKAPVNKALLTLEEHQAIFKVKNQILDCKPVTVSKVVNSVGAGDVATASLTHFDRFQLEPKRTLEKVLYNASESCKNMKPGAFIHEP